jgi:hypothetical protein
MIFQNFLAHSGFDIISQYLCLWLASQKIYGNHLSLETCRLEAFPEGANHWVLSLGCCPLLVHLGAGLSIHSLAMGVGEIGTGSMGRGGEMEKWVGRWRHGWGDFVVRV